MDPPRKYAARPQRDIKGPWQALSGNEEALKSDTEA